MMRMSGEAKFFIGVIVTTVVILIGAIFFFSKPSKEISIETLTPQDAWATGSANPKVTLVEFADFECPACGAAHPFIKQLVERYQNDLRFVYRHFPLDQHKNAKIAAEAVESAGAQGRFWEMHDLLFKNQNQLSREKILGLANEIGLNMEQFTKELDEGKYKNKVEQDVVTGNSVGVTSTPTFFLNGKKLTGASLNQMTQQIEKALQE